MRHSLVLSFVAVLATTVSIQAQPGVASLDAVLVSGLHGVDTVYVGELLRWNIVLTNITGYDITGSTNTFQIYTRGSLANPITPGYYDPIAYDTIAGIGWLSWYDLVLSIKPFSVDGLGADSVLFGGASLFPPGIPNGTSRAVFYFATTAHVDGDTICIDSATLCTPGCPWTWSSSGIGEIFPATNVPLCFHVLNCCNGDGIRGDVDGLTITGQEVNVADVTYLVAYLFYDGPRPPCMIEANIDGTTTPGGVMVDIADLTYMVEWRWHYGPPPPPCP